MKFNDWLRKKVNNWLNDITILESYKCKTLIHVRYYNQEEDRQIVDLSQYKKHGIAVLENYYSVYFGETEIVYTFIENAILQKTKIKKNEIWSYLDDDDN